MYDILLQIQKEIGAIKKDSNNPYFKSKYFDINTLLEHVKPVLNRHGVVITQPLSNAGGRPAISTQLHFKTGVMDCGTITLPDIQDPQKMGSAITYYRRYAIQSLLGLEAEDDDGNIASGKSVPKIKVAVDDKDPF